MKLTKISGTNFMGASFTLALGDLNVVFGSNLSGKSRVRRGVELSLLGYSPALDKTAQSIFKLASGAEMDVEADFNNGQSVHRSWKLHGGSVRVAHHVPKALDGKMPLVMMDAGEYFGRSARGRVELVFASAKVEADALGLALELYKLHSVAPEIDAPNAQEWLDNAFEFVEHNRSEAAANVRRFNSTVQGLSSLQLDDKAPTRSIETIEGEIAAAQKDIGRLAAHKAESEKLQREEETNAMELDRLRHLIQMAGDPIPREFDIEALRSKERLLKEQIAQSDQRRLAHDIWRDKKDKYAKDIIDAHDKLNAAIKQGVDRTPPEKEFCSECGRPYGRTPEDIALVIANREQDRQFAIDDAAKMLHELLVKEPEPEPTPPSNPWVWEAELKAVQDDINEYTRTADVQVWRKQVAELERKSKTFVAPEAFAQQIAMSDEALKKLREERRLAESDRNDRKRLAEARAEHEKAQADEERYKAAKKFLLEKKEELIGQVFGPLLKIANRFADGIALPFKYRDGEFGYERNTPVLHHQTAWVTEATFSGTEQKLLYASLQAALGAQSPCRIVMVDELGTFDKKNWLQFLMNVHDAREAGTFDQFIGFTPRMDYEEQLKGMGFHLVEAQGTIYSTK